PRWVSSTSASDVSPGSSARRSGDGSSLPRPTRLASRHDAYTLAENLWPAGLGNRGSVFRSHENLEIRNWNRRFELTFEVVIHPQFAELGRTGAVFRLNPHNVGGLRRSQVLGFCQMLHLQIDRQVPILVMLQDCFSRSRGLRGRSSHVHLTSSARDRRAE